MQRKAVRIASQVHSLVYRATGGRIGHHVAGIDTLLLTTTGARTGRTRTVPLLYLEDDGHLVIVASYGGRPHHPDWYRNLEAEPRAIVQVRGRILDVVAETVSDDTRDRLWNRALEAWPAYAEYQERTDRLIPLVRLRPEAWRDS